MTDPVAAARRLPRAMQKAVTALAQARNGDVIVRSDARSHLTEWRIAEPMAGSNRYRLTDFGLQVAAALKK